MWGKLPRGRRRRKRRDRVRDNAGRGVSEPGSKEPQANRGDLYALTAATFTVLTGFTRSGPTGLGRVEGIRPPGRGQRASTKSRGSCAPGTSGTVSVERAGDVLDSRLPSLRPGNGDDVESKRAADPGVHSHPGSSRSADVSPLDRSDGFRCGLRTRSTCFDLHECDLPPAYCHKVDLVSSGAPVSREDSVTGPTQQVRGEIFSPAPQSFAIRNRSGLPVDQYDLQSVGTNRHGRSHDQPEINVSGFVRRKEPAASRAADRSSAPRSPARRARRIPPRR